MHNFCFSYSPAKSITCSFFAVLPAGWWHYISQITRYKNITGFFKCVAIFSLKKSGIISTEQRKRTKKRSLMYTYQKSKNKNGLLV